MQKLILIACITLVCTACMAQDSLTWVIATNAVKRDGKEIHIGEKVPDISLDKIRNYPTTATSLNSFLDKPLIIDFWHQYCTVCVGEFERLEQLKQRYKDSVNILLVTFQSSASVDTFFKQRKEMGKVVTLPCVTEDLALRKAFGHEGDPHIVWVSKQGVVQAITSQIALNEKNLSAWLHNGDIHLATKSNQRDFDYNKPLFINNNGGNADAFNYRSLLTGHIDSISPLPLFVVNNEKNIKLAAYNTTIDQLFKDAYALYDSSAATYLNFDWLNKRVVYEYKDSSTIQHYMKAYAEGYDLLTDFEQKHLYCYELDLPSSFSVQEAARSMLDDLTRLFYIKAEIKKIKINGLALTSDGNTEKLLGKLNTASAKQSMDGSEIIVNNMPINSLVNVLNLNYNFPVVVDETGIQKNIDITIPFKKNDLPAIEATLKKYGLSLKPKSLEMPMLVLTDY